jgi:hypothetical protein
MGSEENAARPSSSVQLVNSSARPWRTDTITYENEGSALAVVLRQARQVVRMIERASSDLVLATRVRWRDRRP